MMARVLVTSLGTADYRPVTYAADGREHTTPFAPAATAAIEGGCTRAILLLTETADRKNGQALRAELEALGLDVESRRIPDGRSEQEVWAIFQTTVEAVRAAGESEVVLDVTFAFRHLPVVLFASLAYLSAASPASIRRIRYGALEAGGVDRAPLLDLTPLLTLVDAHHAARQFAETGEARRLGAMLEALNKRLWAGGAGNAAFSRAAKRVADVSAALSVGLPLEIGLHARAAKQAVKAVDFRSTLAPVAAELAALLAGPLDRFALPEAADKKEIALSIEELDRQLRIIRFYLDAGAYDRVLLLLREWIVSRTLLARGATDAWLDYGRRRGGMERALNALVERRMAEKDASVESNDDSETCVSVWSRVRNLRNPLAHGGMCEQKVAPHQERERIRRLVDACAARIADDAWWRVESRGEDDTLLVTALGLSPGVLYSGLAGLWPSRALVVTSAAAGRQAGAACEAANYDAARLEQYVVSDPHRCFMERDKVRAWARPRLLSARKIVVNVTGGTTALQYLVETVGRDAERLGFVVERIALIDRRSSEEQQRNPYVRGEIVKLNEAAAADPDD